MQQFGSTQTFGPVDISSELQVASFTATGDQSLLLELSLTGLSASYDLRYLNVYINDVLYLGDWNNSQWGIQAAAIVLTRAVYALTDDDVVTVKLLGVSGDTAVSGSVTAWIGAVEALAGSGSALATLSELKVRIPVGAATADDAVLQQILDGVSAQIATECNRTIDGVSALLRLSGSTWTEYFDGGVQTISLAAYPVDTADCAVYEDSDRTWGSDTLLTADEDYVLDAAAGLLHREGGDWEDSRRCVKVVYNGGYATAPLDLRDAALTIATINYAHRSDPTRQTVAAGGGSMTLLDPGKWPDSVRRTVQKYTRQIGG